MSNLKDDMFIQMCKSEVHRCLDYLEPREALQVLELVIADLKYEEAINAKED